MKLTKPEIKKRKESIHGRRAATAAVEICKLLERQPTKIRGRIVLAVAILTGTRLP